MKTSINYLRRPAGTVLAIVLAVAAFVPVAPNTVERSETPTPVSVEALRNVTHGFRPIESLEVGQRVLTGFSSDQDRATAVDPTTWKKLTLTATYHWTDGTPDTFHVTTLQSPEWMREQAVAIGAQVPMPLDVQEMGCPDGLLAEVESIEPCPAIQDSPGRVILTTVRHLNSACRKLTVRAPDGTSEEIHTTDYHPFWSETKQGWVKAYTLSIGDQLQGLHGASLTLVCSQSIPGIHTVYNMTVETEHVYRTGRAGLLVHNNCPTVANGATLEKLSPAEITRIQNAADRGGIDITVVGSRIDPQKPLHIGSDYDYVINANSKKRRSLAKSLPGAKDIQAGMSNNQDVFHGAVKTDLAHVVFHPRGN